MNNLKLSANIYDESMIIKAINDYSGISTINLSYTEKHYILIFENNKYDVEITKKEFENYVIDLMVAES